MTGEQVAEYTIASTSQMFHAQERRWATGLLAKLGASISEQNALMVSLLLAPHGGVKIGHDDVVKLPAYLSIGVIPVMHAMPPYSLWEEPAERGRIPPHRTDSGTFLTAEVMGAFLITYPLNMLPFGGIVILDAALLEILVLQGGADYEAQITAGLVLWRLATLVTPFVLGALALVHWQRTDGQGITWRSANAAERPS